MADIDVLITDIGLQDMDGFELQACVEGHYPHIPVFLISGRHEKLYRESFGSERPVLRKPFDGNALLEAIRQALAKRTAVRSVHRWHGLQLSAESYADRAGAICKRLA